MDPLKRFFFDQLDELQRDCPEFALQLRRQAEAEIGRKGPIARVDTVALSNNADDVHNLLAQIKPEYKYLFVIDLDNTVFPQHDNLAMQDIQMLYPLDFPLRTFAQLEDIERSDAYSIKPVILTARSSTDVQCGHGALSNIDKYCTFGFVHCRDLLGTRYPEGLTFSPKAGTELIRAWNTEARRVLHKMIALDPTKQKMLFTGDANAFFIRYNDESIKFKEQMRDFVQSQESEHFKWKSFDSRDGYISIFTNERMNFTKADGLEFILQHQNLDLKDPNLRVVIFGDSSTDLLAMQRAKQLLPAHQVMNVRVGGAIDDPSIDYSFRGPEDTVRFINELHCMAVKGNY